MLKCPECEALIQVNFPADARIDSMADLSRAYRLGRYVGFVKCAECGYEGDPLGFDPRSELPKVDKCYITTKGMVIAFDGEDNQIPECQGFILVVGSELKIRSDENTQWFFGKPGCWLEGADFSWWWLDQ